MKSEKGCLYFIFHFLLSVKSKNNGIYSIHRQSKPICTFLANSELPARSASLEVLIQVTTKGLQLITEVCAELLCASSTSLVLCTVIITLQLVDIRVQHNYKRTPFRGKKNKNMPNIYSLIIIIVPLWARLDCGVYEAQTPLFDSLHIRGFTMMCYINLRFTYLQGWARDVNGRDRDETETFGLTSRDETRRDVCRSRDVTETLKCTFINVINAVYYLNKLR